jgi:hypothetical protein
VKKGIQGCGVDTITGEPGTEFKLPFVVWDRHAPAKNATAERIIRVISPCRSQELYCPGYGAALAFSWTLLAFSWNILAFF